MDKEFQQYINDVLKGKIVVCRKVKQAVQRHVDDIKRSKKADFPYYFDDEAAQRALDFAGLMVHTDGHWAGQYFEPLPFQKFIIGCLMGWRKKEASKISGRHNRRFHRAYISYGRKNGKSFLVSFLEIYLLLSEEGSQVYSASNDRAQASITFNQAKRAVQMNPKLSKLIEVRAHELRYKNGVFRALANVAARADGLGPNGFCMDEYSMASSDDMLNVLMSGTSHRENWLGVIITTCSANIGGPCHEEYERCEKLLNKMNGFDNDEYFVYIAEIDKEDDYRDSSKWIKANPALGKIITVESLMTDFKNAVQKSTALPEFITKHMNRWVNSSDCWIPDDIWTSRCMKRFNEKEIEGLSCYCAIDLSKVNDFTVATFAFPLDNGKVYLKHKYYIPKSQIDTKMKTDSYMIRRWIDDGLITPTEGEVVDYSYMFHDIKQMNDTHPILEIAYDRNLSAMLISELTDSFNCVDFPQNIRFMSGPTKAFEKAVYDGKLIDPSPVQRWQISCATLIRDINDNVKVCKPDAGKSSKRIDSVVTSIMVLSRLQAEQAEYERQQTLSVLDLIN